MTLLFFLFLVFQIGSLLAAPEVQLPNGLIRGREATSLNGKHYYAFEKIPYAAPPVGNLRFKAPVPPSNWDEPLEMGLLDVSCYQVGRDYDYESEDCLYLKVLTPQLPSGGSGASLPVMISIYGGGFVHGTAMGTYSDRIMEQDVILVAMNYRDGIFGFISTQDDVIPGNNGLKDQQLAIKWVHDNIHLFGGDPNKVTIFGQSAGSASCSYQLLNQANAGLFQGAILESGTFLSPWSFQRRAREIAFNTAAFLDDSFKTNRDSNALLQFLQSVDAKTLDDASAQYSSTYGSLETTEIQKGFYWAPVVEADNSDAFITQKMYGLLEAGNLIKVPIMIGMNSEEAISYTQSRGVLTKDLREYDSNLGWLVPDDMGITDEAARTEMGTKIRDMYTNGETLVSNLANGVRFYSDTSFTRSIIKTAEIYSKYAKTYFYQFSYDGDLNHYSIQYDGAEHVGHGQETAYIYCVGTKCDLSGSPESDKLTSQRMVKLWTDFAKYQNPTPQASDVLQSITWPVVSTDGGDFLYLDINKNLEIRNHPKEETYSKWVDLYESLGSTDFDTY